ASSSAGATAAVVTPLPTMAPLDCAAPAANIRSIVPTPETPNPAALFDATMTLLFVTSTTGGESAPAMPPLGPVPPCADAMHVYGDALVVSIRYSLPS